MCVPFSLSDRKQDELSNERCIRVLVSCGAQSFGVYTFAHSLLDRGLKDTLVIYISSNKKRDRMTTSGLLAFVILMLRY